MCLQVAAEEDKKMSDNWKSDADGTLIFVSSLTLSLPCGSTRFGSSAWSSGLHAPCRRRLLPTMGSPVHEGYPFTNHDMVRINERGFGRSLPMALISFIFFGAVETSFALFHLSLFCHVQKPSALSLSPSPAAPRPCIWHGLATVHDA